jgi:hypothetical protein
MTHCHEVNVGLVWLCEKGGLEEDLGIFMAFDKFVIWSWSGELFLGEVCGVTLERRE